MFTDLSQRRRCPKKHDMIVNKVYHGLLLKYILKDDIRLRT